MVTALIKAVGVVCSCLLILIVVVAVFVVAGRFGVDKTATSTGVICVALFLAVRNVRDPSDLNP